LNLEATAKILISSWNQSVLSNEGKNSCSRKQWEPLMGLELTTDRHLPTTSQTRYSLDNLTRGKCGSRIKARFSYFSPNFSRSEFCIFV